MPASKASAGPMPACSRSMASGLIPSLDDASFVPGISRSILRSSTAPPDRNGSPLPAFEIARARFCCGDDMLKNEAELSLDLRAGNPETSIGLYHDPV